eukprot:gene22759-34859_t
MSALVKPSHKETRYDRGIRLWGAAGQRALEDAHVCLLNATAAGCEALKNLALPGIGRLTVVDDALVTRTDLGKNFFVTKDRLGQPKAPCVVENLLEMNPDHVKGGAVEAPPGTLLSDRPRFLAENGVDCVIAADLPRTELQAVAIACQLGNVHLVAIGCCGMVGHIRLQAGGEHCIIEGYPDSSVQDLRVTNPFPELKSYFDSFDLSAITDSHEHSHVPWPVLAHNATQMWQAEEGTDHLPTTYKQRRRVKELLLQQRLPKDPADGETAGETDNSQHLQPRDEENFEEAANNLNKYLPPAIPHEVQA